MNATKKDLGIFLRNREEVLRLLNTRPKEVKSERKILPNFIVIGAPKAGTTAVEQYLHQHPDIYMSPLKNPAFFIWQDRERLFYGRNVVNHLASYHALFQYHKKEKAIGEVSPGYLPDHSAPARMKKLLPDIRLIALLRNPVERAFSQFWFNRQIGAERITEFREALLTEQEIMRGKAPGESQPKYIRGGFYHRHLMRWFEFYDPSQFKLIVYDDFSLNPSAVMSEIFRFLGVDESFVPDVSRKHNVTQVPKIGWLDKLGRGLSAGQSSMLRKAGEKLRRKNMSGLPEIPDSIRLLLEQEYADDIGKLGALLGRDLSHWIKGNR